MKLGLPLTLIAIAALGGTLAFTNPNEDDYAVFLSDAVNEKVQEEICNSGRLSEWLGRVGDALSGVCQNVVTSGGKLSEREVQTFIKDNTDYNNRFFFSTYTTDLPFGTYRGFAVFNKFILRPIEEEQNN
ncbi:MAG: DUF4359 domain-containing protein [Cyanobacteria bacterium J06627_28]